MRCWRPPSSLDGAEEIPAEVAVRVEAGGESRDLTMRVRIDTPVEAAHYRHGGILPYVLRQMLG